MNNLPFSLTWQFLLWCYLILTFLGFLAALNAVTKARTPQGSLAWGIALITVPIFAIPLYWIFGRKKFHGYIELRKKKSKEFLDSTNELMKLASNHKSDLPLYDRRFKGLEKLVSLPFTKGNHATLLIDGKETFRHIFKAIESAENYIIIQFYIWRHQGVGQDIKNALIKKAKAGVKVYALYDEIGSHSLSNAYIEEFKANGILINSFKTTSGKSNAFQINFRNHRKLIIIDGKLSQLGGLNIGDEYLSKGEFKHWRDTHIEIIGPSVLCLQVAFMEDWYWATKTIPQLNWEPYEAEKADTNILAVPTGPADKVETGALFILTLINMARKRLWIATPYFVPDQQVLSALTLAVLRGVDIKLIVPAKSDHKIIGWATQQFLKMAKDSGVKCYHYTEGFMHQKVMLIDDDVSMVGTANMDNRSFRLNFEVNALLIGKEMNKAVEAMLQADLEKCRPYKGKTQSFWSIFLQRIANLFSPIL